MPTYVWFLENSLLSYALVPLCVLFSYQKCSSLFHPSLYLSQHISLRLTFSGRCLLEHCDSGNTVITYLMQVKMFFVSLVGKD